MLVYHIVLIKSILFYKNFVFFLFFLFLSLTNSFFYFIIILYYYSEDFIMTKTSKALLAVFCGNSIFGFSFLASRIILSKTSVFVLLSSRFLLAFLIMNILALFGVFKLNFKGKPLIKVLLLGLCQPIAYFICESYGIELTNSSFSGTLIAVVPLFAFIFATVFIGEKLTIRQLLWGICTVAGVIIVSVGGGDNSPVTLPGVLLLIGAVISGALFNVLSRAASKEFSPFERTYVMFALAAVIFTACAFVESRGKLPIILASLLPDIGFSLSLIFLSLFSSVVAFMLLNYATTYIPVRKTSIFSCLTTVVSIIAGIVFLKEPFGGIRQVIGSALILIGVYMISIAEKNN